MQITFFKPSSLRGRYTVNNPLAKVSLYVANKGKKRKGSTNALNIKKLVTFYKLPWNYAAIGVNENGQLIIGAGSKDNGYLISKTNFEISNKQLNADILKILDCRYPTAPDDSVKVDFSAEFNASIQGYILTKI